ncbi:ATP-dependent DNA helicase pfh1-like [Lucilia sericata]|uniref:ATP-dependent DNA helicase pfh1-like n=1 Tax=Lucilia sericata TaxID=13632 RepID=UPI0018A86B80|nr:ATP-dependent DNA helicase pfh1-like [Lucilia sericata]XP_037811954.1 ATP-dependent DNA helicase pfh1-like [Lucilia sericata]
MPWKNEKDDILDNDNEATCRVHKNIIERNRSVFEKYKEGDLEEILQQIQDDNRMENENQHDNRAVTQLLDDEFRALAVPEVDDNINIIDTNDDYINTDENNDGKREVLYNSIPGSNPDLPKVLLSAPTGKAAFGIGGATLHSLFSLPVNQYSGEIRPLSNDTVNTLSSLLLELKLLIIDEISMVGARMLGYLDARLKQIFKSTERFGGISILVFGDLKQLPPVGDKWIFSPNSSNPYEVIVGDLLWNQFKFYELTEITRQREDRESAQALNSMLKGEMNNEEVQLIKSRVVDSNFNFSNEAIHLFWSNAEADQYNELKFKN